MKKIFSFISRIINHSAIAALDVHEINKYNNHLPTYIYFLFMIILYLKIL